jgi:hypothetical protein
MLSPSRSLSRVRKAQKIVDGRIERKQAGPGLVQAPMGAVPLGVALEMMETLPC